MIAIAQVGRHLYLSAELREQASWQGMKSRISEFRGRGARVQYHLLMGLYRFAVNRWLYGIFCRFLARFFASGNAVALDLGQRRRFWIHLDDTYWTRFVLFHGDYEPEVRRVLDAAAGHVDLFCDLGANKGLWSVYGSTLFSRVVAVEASAETFGYLEENTQGLANVTCHRAAIYARSGETLTFVNTYQSHASARLSPSGDAGDRDRTETVATISVDDLVPAGTAALIKLDVEGAETEAIDGAARALSEGSVLIYEDHGGDISSATSAHLLKMADISLYSVETEPQEITNTDAVRALKTDKYTGYNFLAARRDSALLAAILEGFAKPPIAK